MKKILIPILLLTLVAGATFYFTRSSTTPDNSEYYADYLPPDTLVTISLIDLKGLSHSFPTSSLGKFLSKATMREIMTELAASPEDINKYDAMYNGLADVMTNPAFRQIFGDDTVAALLPPDLSRLQTEREQEMQRSLLVFGTSSVTGPLETLARLLISKNVSKETVNGLDLTRIQLDEDETIYGYAEDSVIVLSYNPATIVMAIKQNQIKNSLQDTDSFKAIKQFWAETPAGRKYSQTYINMASISALFATAENKEARNIAQFLHGFTSAGSIVIDRQGELQITNRVNYDYESLNEVVKQQFHSLSEDNLSLNLLTPNTLAYYWTSTLDKNAVHKTMLASGMEQYNQADVRIQKELGLPLESLLDAFGPQTGLVVNDIVKGMLFPLPKIIIFLQIQNHETAQQVLSAVRQKIADRGFAAEQQEEVNGHTIYYWPVLPGEATQPAIVLTNDMLYIANGKSSLKSLLSGKQTKTNLPVATTETLGKELVTDINTSNHSTFVMRPARLSSESKNAAGWLTTMLTASNNWSAEKLKDELLTLMLSIDAIVATVHLEKDYAGASVVFKQAASTQEMKK